MKEAVFSKQLRDDIQDYFDGEVDIVLIQDSYRSGKKPYDFHFLREGIFVAIELKAVNGKSIAMSSILPHQPKSLRDKWENGGKGFFVICFSQQKTAFVMSPILWEKLAEAARDDCRVSVTYEMFEECSDAFERKKIDDETRWDIETMWNAMENIDEPD